jgi:uncharacterized protein DUF6527
MRRTSFDHEFVEFIPSELQEGVLYISIPYATAVHKCACGCGNKVVTPISPVDWQLLFDGDTVSLTPSIGNWQFPCHSHYWIKSNKVRWSGAWSPEQIAEGSKREARDRERYFANRHVVDDTVGQAGAEVQAQRRAHKRHLDRVLRWLGR